MSRRLTYPLLLLILLMATTASLNTLQAQVQHGKLRDEVLESQKPPTTPTTRRTGRRLTPLPPVAPIRSPFDQKKARIIYMEHADVLRFRQSTRPDVQILIGNVRFRHDDAVMTCDSAYFYRLTNSLDAFSNVKIVQGDTLSVYGDLLHYDGTTKLARLRKRVRMINRNTTLTTDSLNYDRTTQLAYYFTGGKVVDPENTLTSVWGQYSTATEDALFRDDVKLVNQNFVMTSDTLKYNTKNSIANIVGDTHIVYQDETDIFTDRGWYNTKTERSMLLNRSMMVNKEGKSLTGDTIFYDKSQNYGESFGDVILNDTVQKSTLYGDYIYYNEDTELGIATDSALLVDWSGEYSMYVHADTLKTFKDSIYNEAKAWENVRIYREDLQGIADTLIYSSRDSVIHLLNSPIVWQQSQQLSSENIRAYTKNKKIDKVVLENSAITVEQVDSLLFNQISGKDIIAYVDSGALKRVEVSGNAETVYFVQDDLDSTLIGANRTESSFVVMHFVNKKIDRIILTTASSGVFYPLERVSDDVIYMPNFFWADHIRPLSETDVFRRVDTTDRPRFSYRDASEVPEDKFPTAPTGTPRSAPAGGAQNRAMPTAQ